MKYAQLLEYDSDLMSDIKSLDGDMQMLVYENYNKFISATDTIRKMKNRVEVRASSGASHAPVAPPQPRAPRYPGRTGYGVADGRAGEEHGHHRLGE